MMLKKITQPFHSFLGSNHIFYKKYLNQKKAQVYQIGAVLGNNTYSVKNY